MSASNWGICPRCQAVRAKALAKVQQLVGKSYGKVPPEEYDRLRRIAAARPEAEETLREDYEQGLTSDGTYCVSYRGECQACAFVFSYRHEQLAPDVDATEDAIRRALGAMGVSGA